MKARSELNECEIEVNKSTYEEGVLKQRKQEMLQDKTAYRMKAVEMQSQF